MGCWGLVCTFCSFFDPLIFIRHIPSRCSIESTFFVSKSSWIPIREWDLYLYHNFSCQELLSWRLPIPLNKWGKPGYFKDCYVSKGGSFLIRYFLYSFDFNETSFVKIKKSTVATSRHLRVYFVIYFVFFKLTHRQTVGEKSFGATEIRTKI